MTPEVRDALLGSLVIVIGVVSGAVQILQAVHSVLQLVGFSFLVCGGAVLGSWRPISNALRRGRNDRVIAGVEHLRRIKDSKRQDGIETKKEAAVGPREYIVEPASEEDIEWTVGLRSKKYGPEDALPEAILKDWYYRNTDCFFVIRAKDGNRVGHIDVLPLHPDALRLFREGHIKEEGIRGSCLYAPTPEEKEKITDLYVEGLIIDRDLLPKLPSGRTVSGFKVMVDTFLDLNRILSKVCNPRNLKKIYTIAATKDGEKLVDALNFEPQKAGKKRKDKHNFYVIRYETLLANITQLLGKHYSE